MVAPLRDLFLLDPDIVYLNHGSYGACARSVFARYQTWQRELEWNPMGFIGERLPRLLAEAREALGAYLGASSDDVVYFVNPTTAVRRLCRSLHLEPGDEVLMTDWEYPAMDETWNLIAHTTGVRVIRQAVPIPLTDSDAFVDALWEGVTSRTRIIFLSHIAAFCALTFPVAEVCRRARQAGILTFIDGAHAPSNIPLDLSALDVDLYVGACHKWLSAPKGAGFAYAHPRIQAALVEDIVLSRPGGAGDPTAPGQFVAVYQQQGTRDPAAYLTVPAAIQFQADHDWDAQRVRCHTLAQQTRARLTEMTGLAPLSPDSREFYSQMVAVPIPAERLGVIQAELRARRIYVVITGGHGNPVLRVSYQAYNDQDDADRLVAAIGAALARG